MSPGALKRCPPFCHKSCQVIHHPVLLALLNVRANDRTTLQRFARVVSQYYDSELNQATPLPDPVFEYKYPLLLWAAVLGKTTAVEYLKSIGHDPRIQSNQKNETALHRVVHCLHTSMQREHYSQAAILRTFQRLADLLAPALIIQDDSGDTPLHVCATYITDYHLNCRFDFYKNALAYMIDKVTSMEDNEEISVEGLDIQNKLGNTVFHLISHLEHEACVELAHKLLNNDASVRLRNRNRRTVIDIAAERSLPIFNLITEKYNKLKRRMVDPPGSSSIECSKARKGCTRSSVVSSTSNGDNPDGVSSSQETHHEIPFPVLAEEQKSSNSKDRRRFISNVSLGSATIPSEAATNTCDFSAGRNESSQRDEKMSSTTCGMARPENNKPAGLLKMVKEEDVVDNVPSSSGERDVYEMMKPLDDLLNREGQSEEVFQMIGRNRRETDDNLQESKHLIKNLGEQERECVNECNELELKIGAKKRELADLEEKMTAKRQKMSLIQTKRENEEKSCSELQRKVNLLDEIMEYLKS